MNGEGTKPLCASVIQKVSCMETGKSTPLRVKNGGRSPYTGGGHMPPRNQVSSNTGKPSTRKT